ncbi:MAG: UDP-N-acetylmuramate--L-alanine ligase [Rhodospirillaceae bacterium]|jgi:UDP-N-acetylmuramate--alanine ligase|nr:UDP-N-acetylmuramate--L-alanine ligase [Rhodospirillaceae bacterium]
MRALPLTIGTIHFCGIGGIGMSGIAEVLHNLEYSVQGSDVAESANVKRLTDMGIQVHIGQHGDNLGDASVIVVSSAIKPDNPELVEARQRLIPVVRRAEMLAELMRLKWAIAVGGTHGKTTTTSLIASMLDTADYDPTVINGGIINAYGTNARLGDGDWIVVEADESDGTFIKLPATIAVVTNIDPEHLDFYGSFEALRQAFITFVENIPFYGLAVLCIDHPEVQALIPQVSDRRIVTYGMNPQADIRAENLTMDASGVQFDVVFSGRSSIAGTRLDGLTLPMAGQHNAQNALSAVAIAQEMGIPGTVIRQALAGFTGVKRRFSVTGSSRGITVVDDYGHHPVEIAAVLAAARGSSTGRVIAVVQPHRYTRLRDLFEDFCTCFNDADTVIVADVYPAGEEPIEGTDRDALVDGLRAHGHRDVMPLSGPEDLPATIANIAAKDDYVICLGAGSITNWANALPADLDALSGQSSTQRGATS